MTNTERLIANLQHATEHGAGYVEFVVGRYTGNGPSVVAALRRRGFMVTRTGRPATYRLEALAAA